VLSIAPLQAQLVTRTAGEIAFGPAVATLGNGSTIEHYPGFAIGTCFNFYLLKYGVGTLGLTTPIMAVIGSRPEQPGADFQRVHIPLGILLAVGDASGFEGSGSVGGSLSFGYGATFGAFTENVIDTRPWLSMDISIGIFKRGALKIRYSGVLGTYEYRGKPVNYHGIYLVGSSAW